MGLLIRSMYIDKYSGNNLKVKFMKLLKVKRIIFVVLFSSTIMSILYAVIKFFVWCMNNAMF